MLCFCLQKLIFPFGFFLAFFPPLFHLPTPHPKPPSWVGPTVVLMPREQTAAGSSPLGMPMGYSCHFLGIYVSVPSWFCFASPVGTPELTLYLKDESITHRDYRRNMSCKDISTLVYSVSKKLKNAKYRPVWPSNTWLHGLATLGVSSCSPAGWFSVISQAYGNRRGNLTGFQGCFETLLGSWPELL